MTDSRNPGPTHRRLRVRPRLVLVACFVAMLAMSVSAAKPPIASADVPSTIRSDIAAKAVAQQGKTCGSYTLNGYDGCDYNWCSIFAGWVWHNADSRIDVSDLKTYAKDFYDYGKEHSSFTTAAPQVGDAVVFVNVKGGGSSAIHHVGIVTSVTSSSITYVAGNESPPTPSIVFKHTIGKAVGTKTAGSVWLYGYVSPVLKVPTGLSVSLSNPADGQVSLSWSSAYNPDSFKVTRTDSAGATKTVASALSGSARQVYDYVARGVTYTYKVCAVVGGISACSTKKYTASY